MIRLHHAAQTRSFRVLWALEELGLGYELVRVSLLDGSLRGPDYRVLSPAGRVPAIEIDGGRMAESGAILQWLSEREGRLGPGAGERADWLEWLHYAETAGAHLANLTQQHIVLREDWMRSPTVMTLEARRLARVLAAVEDRARGEWLLGGFSMADIAMGYSADIATRFIPLEGLPRTAAWLGRLRARPGFLRARAADGPAELYRQPFYPPPAATPPAAAPSAAPTEGGATAPSRSSRPGPGAG
ncbi:glutathione S-transferase family protein [Frigidibacter sp. MR17.24]|uniref:glutathione S-transferase family protein n=1 Tax=Frigidibacter sp. MR17.24 TaxID=3127345 RepID=UPI00301318EA